MSVEMTGEGKKETPRRAGAQQPFTIPFLLLFPPFRHLDNSRIYSIHACSIFYLQIDHAHTGEKKVKPFHGMKETVEIAEFIRNGLLLMINSEFANLEKARARILAEENGDWFLQNQYNDPQGIGEQAF